MKEVKIKIIAEVTANIEIESHETIENIKNRLVDIYLHTSNQDKIDLGADKYDIEIVDDSKFNPFASDAKIVRVRNLSERHKGLVKNLPNFHYSGSVRGMKQKYYGKGALLVKCGAYIYNVSSDPQIYYQYAV